MDNNISVEKKLMYHRNTMYKINLLFLSYLIPYILSIIFPLLCLIGYLKSGTVDKDSYFVIVYCLICKAAVAGGLVLRLFSLKSFRYVNKYLNISYLLLIVSVVLNFVQFAYIVGFDIGTAIYRLLVFADSCLVLLILFFVYKGYQKVLDDNQCVKKNPVLLLMVFQLEIVILRAVGMLQVSFMENFEYTVQPFIDLAFLVVLYKFIRIIIESSIIVYNIYDDIFEKFYTVAAALAIFTFAYVSLSTGNSLYVADDNTLFFKEGEKIELNVFWPENILEASDSIFPGFTLGVKEGANGKYNGTLTSDDGIVITMNDSWESMLIDFGSVWIYENNVLYDDISQLTGNKIISDDVINNDGVNEIILSRNANSDYYSTELTIYIYDQGTAYPVNIPENINETIAKEFSIKCSNISDGELTYVLTGPDEKENELVADISNTDLDSINGIEAEVYSGRSFMYVDNGKVYTAIRTGLNIGDGADDYVYGDYIIARLEYSRDEDSFVFSGDYDVIDDLSKQLYSTVDTNIFK